MKPSEITYERRKRLGTDSTWDIIEVRRRPLCSVESEAEAGRMMDRLMLADNRGAELLERISAYDKKLQPRPVGAHPLGKMLSATGAKP